MIRRYSLSDTWPAVPLIALSGRSNVGKSSLINRLLGTPIAGVSRKPGRTREISLYQKEPTHLWVDLPGYGYAGTSQAERMRWEKETKVFLRERRPFVWVLVDSRIPPQRIDREWIAWLESLQLPYGVLATKADGLSQKTRYAQQKRLREAYPQAQELFFVSSRTGEGLAALHIWLSRWLKRKEGEESPYLRS
ncbi:MAG: ribosome biogenesis GTP-binding protein YihA/YsxC [Bacteroidia bacterium]|nr:ribosome biogenesis GTP-binding protein YihA/YsxC [Bacteroidia bacterium]